MANFRTATIAAALFCLFSISLSRAPPQTNDEATTIGFTELDPELRLPTEPLKTEADANSAAVPLTDITFRPVNRRFRVRSKQPCRHHFKFYPAMRENKPIPYGNDNVMIQLSGENSDFDEPIVRGGGKRIPGRWMRTHHRHRHHQLSRRVDDDTDTDTDDEQNVDRVKRVVLKRFNYDRIDREKKMQKLREHFRARIAAAEEEEKPKKGSFMKGVRKFLDRYV